jgi:hypothetical protein
MLPLPWREVPMKDMQCAMHSCYCSQKCQWDMQCALHACHPWAGSVDEICDVQCTHVIVARSVSEICNVHCTRATRRPEVSMRYAMCNVQCAMCNVLDVDNTIRRTAPIKRTLWTVERCVCKWPVQSCLRCWSSCTWQPEKGTLFPK